MSDEHVTAAREQAQNELDQAKALGLSDAVQAAEKRLAALGDTPEARTAEPTEPKPKRQTRR